MVGGAGTGEKKNLTSNRPPAQEKGSSPREDIFPAEKATERNPPVGVGGRTKHT